MKKIALLLCVALSLSLTACREEPPAESPETPPLRLDTLSVEVSRNGLPTEQLLSAVQELPDLLRDRFAQSGTGVEIREVTVTIGTSPAATAQALAEGTVDLAFLPAEALALYGREAAVLALDAPQPALDRSGTEPEAWNGGATAYHETVPWSGGTFALICAAPTTYGTQLAARVRTGTGEALTWEELDHARWGVLGEGALGGRRCLELWLADQYEGNELGDLTDVSVYGNYEELLRAAARGEIDAFPIRADARMDVAEAWTLLSDQTAPSGMRGFGRDQAVWDEIQVIGVTERLYDTAAAVAAGREDLSGEESAFPEALDGVLECLAQERPDLMETLGAAHFHPAGDEALDPLRRLLLTENRGA